MDSLVLAKLQQADIDATFRQHCPIVGLQVDDKGSIQAAGAEVVVLAGPNTAYVPLKKISELFAGTKTPPSFRNGPTDEYAPFFSLIELTVIDFCHCAGRDERDAEIERLYTHLRRRPDGQDGNPLFSYMQAAVRLHMSVRDVSQAEFDAVCRRLSLSAKHFGTGSTSTNYCEIVGGPFVKRKAASTWPVVNHEHPALNRSPPWLG